LPFPFFGGYYSFKLFQNTFFLKKDFFFNSKNISKVPKAHSSTLAHFSHFAL